MLSRDPWGTLKHRVCHARTNHPCGACCWRSADGAQVRIVLDGVDKYQNLFGSVMYPDGDKPASLAETLVQAGLAKVRAGRGTRG